VAVERPEVERRGMLAADAVVGCRCMLMAILVEAEDWRECVETERECPALALGVVEVARKEVGGGEKILEEAVLVCW
jgi:hypothetical protein